jgi:hypothetical protein
MHTSPTLRTPLRARVLALIVWLLAGVPAGPGSAAATSTDPSPARAGAVQDGGEPARRSPAELTAIARLLAGIDSQGGGSAVQAVARSDAWKAHRKASRYGDRQLQERLQRMDSWQRSSLPPPREGAALIYPFSGPDFVNAFALFPDYKTYVFFSLEPPGDIPALAGMDEHQLSGLFSDLRIALNDLVALNFFITPNMQGSLHTDSLQGTVPLLLAQMGLLGLRVERVEPFEPWPGSALRATPGEPAKASPATKADSPALPLQAVRIDFTDQTKTRRTLVYLSLDVSDSQLRFYPQFVPWLRSYEDPTVLLKSASYLLHGTNFRKVRGRLQDLAVRPVRAAGEALREPLSEGPGRRVRVRRQQRPGAVSLRLQLAQGGPLGRHRRAPAGRGVVSCRSAVRAAA